LEKQDDYHPNVSIFYNKKTKESNKLIRMINSNLLESVIDVLESLLSKLFDGFVREILLLTDDVDVDV
jgi:hypothetical protein